MMAALGQPTSKVLLCFTDGSTDGKTVFWRDVNIMSPFRMYSSAALEQDSFYLKHFHTK